MLTNIEHFDFFENLNSQGEKWDVIYTKSRRETKVADYCLKESIRFYLPLEKRTKCYWNKKVHTTLPLFPGYIFCSANKKEQYELLLTHDIVRILNVSNQFELIEDLEKIYIAESYEINLIPCEFNIEGRRARIEMGPMRGLEGLISRIKGRDRIILNVNFINRAAAVEINRTDITLLN